MGAVENFAALSVGQPRQRSAELISGTLVRVELNQCVWVDYAGNPFNAPLAAICTAHVDVSDIGREVALAFAQGDPAQPILLGLIRRSWTQTPGSCASVKGPDETSQTSPAHVQFNAAETMTLQCGRASLTLNRDGRVIVRGTNIASYADGTLRLRGAVVELN